jgi:hypothetical protein
MFNFNKSKSSEPIPDLPSLSEIQEAYEDLCNISSSRVWDYQTLQDDKPERDNFLQGLHIKCARYEFLLGRWLKKKRSQRNMGPERDEEVRRIYEGCKEANRFYLERDKEWNRIKQGEREETRRRGGGMFGVYRSRGMGRRVGVGDCGNV